MRISGGPGHGAGKPSRFATRVNSLGLGAAGLDKILDALESRDRVAAPRRAFVRWPFRKESVSVLLLRADRTAQALRVACRNLSTMGLSFLHCAYVQPGTQCQLTLPGADDDGRDQRGTVVRAHRAGMMHEVGVEFDTAIDLRDYLPRQMDIGLGALEKVQDASLRGVLVHYCAQSTERAFLRERFRATPLCLRSVADPAAFRHQLELGCDAVLIDAPREQAREVAKAATGIVIGGVAANTMEARMMQLSIAGLAGIAVKPLTGETLAKFVAELFHLKRVANHARKAHWSERLHVQCERAHRAAASGDSAACAAACTEIEKVAHRAGNNDLAFLAARVRTTLEGKSAAGLVEAVRDLVRAA